MLVLIELAILHFHLGHRRTSKASGDGDESAVTLVEESDMMPL